MTKKQRFKKVVEYEWSDNFANEVYDSLTSALFFPLIEFCKAIFHLIIYGMCFLGYPFFIILIICDYFNKRKVYWVKIK